MQNSVFYCNKNFIAEVTNEEKIDKYYPVTFQQKDLKVVDLTLEVRTHRLILTSQTTHAFLVQCQNIQSIDISESGLFWGKQYSIKLKTKYGKVKLYLKNYNEAKITIQSVLQKKSWLKTEQTTKKASEMYSGMFNRIEKEKQKINNQENTVQGAFTSFDSLFANLRDLKSIMGSMKSSTGEVDGDSTEVNKILKDIGFVNVVSKDQAGRDFIKHLANDLFQICHNTLFGSFGGMVSLLDLFYFYNKKRQLELVSPDELYQACQQFQNFGYKAKLVEYPNNIKMIESTSFDSQKDFEQNFSQYFSDYKNGYSAQQISRKKGLPLSIIQIKLKTASKNGKLAIDDRIQGIKYYKNFFLTL